MDTTSRLLSLLRSSSSMDDFLSIHKSNQLDCTLSQYLNTLLEEKQLSKSEVIRNSLLDPYYAYQIFRGKKQPSREKLLQLAFAFPLSEKEVQLLLYWGGVQKLYIKNRRDSIFLYALEHGLSLQEVSDLLLELRESPLL